jgi:hypothetical protein
LKREPLAEEPAVGSRLAGSGEEGQQRGEHDGAGKTQKNRVVLPHAANVPCAPSTLKNLLCQRENSGPVEG